MKKKTVKLLNQLFEDEKITFKLSPDRNILVDYSLTKVMIQGIVKAEYGYIPKKDSTCESKMDEMLTSLFCGLAVKYEGATDEKESE